jgi:hypothetical protein
MARKEWLTLAERDELMRALLAAHAAVKKAQETVTMYSDIYDAASYTLVHLDTLAEAVTGDRRLRHKMPYRG